MKKDLSTGILTSIIGIILGILFMFFANDILKLFLIIFGIIIILMALPTLIYSLTNSTKSKYDMINVVLSIINIIFGILLIFVSNNVLFIIAGVWILIKPVYALIVSHNNKEVAKQNLSTLVVGLVLILLGITKSFGFFAYIVGGVFVVLSIINLIYYIVIYLKEQKEKKDNEAIDA